CRRELVRFLRQRHRIIGALATPIVFWLLIGGGMSHSFKSDASTNGGGYMEYFFPGTILMILLFTAIFSTISIIEDRREGFLQSVLVAPVSRLSIVLGKVLGGTVLAFGQAFIFLLLAPTVGIHMTLVGFLASLLMMLILAFALTALGFCIAWPMSSTQGFHAIMNLFLMPMWFLSGALFPPGGAAGFIRAVMMINPLTYGMEALRRAMYWGSPSYATSSHMPGFAVCAGITVAFAAALMLLASVIAQKRTAADLQ
ncbi:MAG TPA: ABC transporter permease, partial [Tepidisphaeraceae bacterium]|nr:ABC transporter permease [Tepidisphaeraceae bacterium]